MVSTSEVPPDADNIILIVTILNTEVATAYDKPWSQVKTRYVMDSTSNWIKFSNKVGTLGVMGLFGCTSVVVISEQGAWAAHFWEKTFSPQDVLPTLQKIKGGKYDNEYGLANLRNNDEITEGRMFDDINQPRIFVLAPRVKVALPNGEPDNSETAGGDVLGDQQFVGAIIAELRNTFGAGAKLSTIKYSPMRSAPLRSDLRDNEFETHRGKLLVQYQPAQGTCRPKAAWRVWFEGRGKLSWVPCVRLQDRS